uniref:Uncharacterized protein n=1 Tax=Leersia perrieri TaxID=77586 RepID=A0A0D9XBP9_9ORYZ
MTLNLLVSPLLSFAVLKVGNALIEQFCRMYGMKDNREKLQRQLLALQAVIANAEQRGAHEPHVRAWLKELTATAYKAVDVLDEFQYEALHRNAVSQEPSSSIKKVTKRIILQKNPILFRYKMSKKLKTILEKIDEIISEMKNFNFIVLEHQPIISRPPTHSCIVKSEIVGRDDAKEDIMNILVDPNREMVNVSVFAIVGMGGAGKTTLAKLVYNEEKVKEHFKLRMWVCVSNDFSAVSVVKSIIEVATGGQSIQSTSNLEVLQARLREILVGRKYLLVLDDVWNEDIYKWDALRILLFSSACLGSVIVVTTRSKKVATIMGTLPHYNLKMLSDEESWKLFRKRAFDDAEEAEQLVEIGRKIVSKCAGLPLALMAIGGLMRTTRDDYEFEKETLVQLWMANDFIPNDEIMDAEDKGEYIFSELCWRSFFQDTTVWGSLYLNKVTYCKMHDLMHDLAKHISGKQCVSTLEVENDQVLHLSVVNQPSSDNLDSILKGFPIIRTCLISKGFATKSENVKNYDSMKTISLRALQLKQIVEIPNIFGYMKHLRCLDLSYGKFGSLPEIISTLYNLQTLNLSGSKISNLPERMRYMISLRHLFINGCPNLKRMACGLGQLKSLRILTNYIVEPDPGRNIGQLNDLNLHEFLWLSGLENVRDKNEAQTANMVSKINLSSLHLTWGSLDNRDGTINEQEVLHGLRPSTDIKNLHITGYSGSDFPIWMKETLAMRNLSALYLVNCHRCTTLPPVWHFPVMKCLHLKRMRSLVYIYHSTEDEEIERLVIFQNLTSFHISSLDNLEGWHDKDNKLVAFPRLDELFITSCPKMRTIPSAPLLRALCVENSREIKLLEISNLSMIASSFITIACESSTDTDAFKPPKNVATMSLEGFDNVIPLQENNMETNQNMTLRDLTITRSNCFFPSGPCKHTQGFWKYFAFLEILYIDDCDALSFWPEQEFRNLNCLKNLHIDACDNFTCTSQMSSSSTESHSGSSNVPPPSIESCKEDILPRLETLIIEECRKLVEIPSCCKSLKTLTLQDCPSIRKEGLNYLKNLHELKELTLDKCTGLNSLPDDLDSLTSLERLIIYNCPLIEAFPEGLQQRLPALQSLKIKAGSVLLGLCRSGGYHRLISSIPDLTIDPI